MKRTLLILISLFAIVSATNAVPVTKGTTARWDFVTSFTTTTVRQCGVATDGEFIYTSVFTTNASAPSMFYKYDMLGNFIESFDLPGCGFIRDLTYDGQYFYGGAVTHTLYCMDLANKVLIDSTITNVTSIRHCTYDPTTDGFWVGEANLKLINRAGEVQFSAPHATSCNGSAFFTDENGEDHVLMFCCPDMTALVYDYNITTNTLSESPVFDFSSTPGFANYDIAGGAFIGDYYGATCFFGDIQHSPNIIGIYAMGDDMPNPPMPPTPPAGDLFYDFEDNILSWTSIDADGDGYCWEMRRNWGNQENVYSATSSSNYAATPLHPDNYLVSPLKLAYSEISFIACAQDASYPAEHFGIAVSTGSNTDPADFTTIWEETLTAKPQGQWYAFTVDLSAYAGQEIWVAFRHFDCTDQFWLNIDDIYLSYETVGVEENASNLFTVYPNPARERLMVNSELTVSRYDLFNVMGALVESREVGLKSFEVNISDLPAGTYILRLASEGLVRTKRFVKQ